MKDKRGAVPAKKGKRGPLPAPRFAPPEPEPAPDDTTTLLTTCPKCVGEGDCDRCAGTGKLTVVIGPDSPHGVYQPPPNHHVVNPSPPKPDPGSPHRCPRCDGLGIMVTSSGHATCTDCQGRGRRYV